MFRTDIAIRFQAAGFAADRLAGHSTSMQTSMLESVDASLEDWKASQAGDDGCVEITEGARSMGLLTPASLGGASLSLLSGTRGPKKLRIAVSKLSPEQCAGADIGSKAELVWKLWLQRHAEIAIMADSVGVDVLLACLVAREAESMPVDSLANCMRYIWLIVLSEKISAQATVEKIQEKKKRLDDHLALARAKKRSDTAIRIAARKQAMDRYAFDWFRGQPGDAVLYVAQKIKSGVDGCQGLSVHTITKMIEGQKALALRSLRRDVRQPE